jgi:hypothetical protein
MPMLAPIPALALGGIVPTTFSGRPVILNIGNESFAPGRMIVPQPTDWYARDAQANGARWTDAWILRCLALNITAALRRERTNFGNL